MSCVRFGMVSGRTARLDLGMLQCRSRRYRELHLPGATDQPTTMRDKHLKLSDPAMMRALRDIPTMQRWEILRRTGRAMSVAELASAAESSLQSTQQSLDSLVSARLVDSKPATSRRRQPTYRAAMARLILSWRRTDPDDAAAWRSLDAFMRDYSRRVRDEASERPGSEQFAPFNYGGCVTVLLLDEDALRVREGFRAAYALLAEADQRARESAAAADAKPYHVSFSLQRLWKPEPPMAEFFVVEETHHERERRLLESGAGRLLSPRELEVARLLQRGMSRPRIAVKLGLTSNTVGSISKIVYRKLGVNSRAQLAERMRII